MQIEALDKRILPPGEQNWPTGLCLRWLGKEEGWWGEERQNELNNNHY